MENRAFLCGAGHCLGWMNVFSSAHTLPEENTQIFASEYKLYLPTEDELIREVDEVAKLLEGMSD